MYTESYVAIHSHLGVRATVGTVATVPSSPCLREVCFCLGLFDMVVLGEHKLHVDKSKFLRNVRNSLSVNSFILSVDPVTNEKMCMQITHGHNTHLWTAFHLGTASFEYCQQPKNNVSDVIYYILGRFISNSVLIPSVLSG